MVTLLVYSSPTIFKNSTNLFGFPVTKDITILTKNQTKINQLKTKILAKKSKKLY